MYCEFYQLTERPFNVTPDPKFLYLNARYREALASLNYGITQRKGFITLIGEAGTGKTTLLNKLLEDFDPKTKSVFIFNTNVTFEEILEYIFAEFDLPVHNGKKLYMLQRLNSFLLEELRGGGNVALLIDEAQDLEFSVMEDLRLLSNLETAKEKILQIVLSGQPELGQKLSNPVLRQLRQRIGINCRLLPLSRDEITEYIQYRLQAAGCPDLKLFSREAEEQIYHFSRGIPRLVNVVCDNALVIGYALGKKRIGADVITEAAADLLAMEGPAEERTIGEGPVATVTLPSPIRSESRWRGRLGVIGLVLAALLVGLFSVGRTMLRTSADESPSRSTPEPKFQVIRPGSIVEGTDMAVPPAEGDEGDSKTAARHMDVIGTKPAAAMAGEHPGSTRPAVVAEKADIHRPVVSQPASSREANDTDPSTVKAQAPGASMPTRSRPAKPPIVNDQASTSDPGSAKGSASRHDEAAKTVVLASKAPATGQTGMEGATSQSHQGLRAALSQGPVAGKRPRLDGIQFGTVLVQPGDTMSKIALRRYGRSNSTVLDLLRLANPALKDIDFISIGEQIRLPNLGAGLPMLNDGSGHYALLVFSTPVMARATELEKSLRNHGFKANVEGGRTGSRKRIFRVVISGFASRQEVAETGERVQKLFRDNTKLARLAE